MNGVLATAHGSPGSWLTHADFVDCSPVYHIAPGTLVFDNPPAIIVPFDNIPGEGPTNLAVYFSEDGCDYTRVPDSYVNAGFMNASVRRGGFLFAGYPKTASEANCP